MQAPSRKDFNMSEDTPKRKIAVLYHADADGWGSAFAIWKALKDTCELLFLKVQYGQEPPNKELIDFAPEKIFIVDFSYGADTLNTLQMITPDITVIDHHKTSLSELIKWAGEGADIGAVGSLRQHICHGGGSFFHDENMAGCTLTWSLFHLDPDWNPEEFGPEVLHPSAPAPEILLYVADRDLWRFDLEHSKEINAFIATLPEDFEVWDNFYTPEAYDCGKAILAFQARQIKARMKDVRVLYFGTNSFTGDLRFCEAEFANALIDPKPVPFCSISDNVSEVGEALCFEYPDSPFSVTYCDRGDGQRSYSLRSRNGFDVSVVAKAFGGGGHPGAAGFSRPAPDII